jgi:hypothetical protein
MITGRITKVEKDGNGAILVWTQYLIDDVEINSPYPKVDNKSVFCVKYDPLNFVGKTNDEIKEIVNKDINSHLNTLVRKECIKTYADTPITSINSLVGTELSKDTGILGLGDKQITVKQDGTIVDVKTISKVL